MGAAVAVLVHGLAKRPGKTSEADQRPFAAAMSKAEDPAGAAPALCGLALASVASLDSVAADKEAVFILLPGDSRDSAQDASLLVEATVNKLSSKGKRVAAFTLKNGAEDHERLVRQFSIASLPGVVVAGRDCGSTAVWGEITETKLLQAFVAGSTPSSSCGPSGCGPAGCK
jgi:hypothetical protein